MSKLFQANKNSEEEIKMSKDLVFIQNDQVLTDSRVVAEYFDKRHDNVVKSVRELIGQIEDSSKVRSPMFYESTYVNSQNKKQPMYLMNRDGFTMRGVA